MPDPMAGLDHWITGNWGDNQFKHEDEFCDACIHATLVTHPPGHYHCAKQDKLTGAEDWCEEWEVPGPEDDGDRRYDEMVDREEPTCTR